jgi:hypothetical protein
MMLGGAGIGLNLRGKPTNAISVPPGSTYTIPAGNYIVSLGPYTELQFLDPVTGIWRTQLWPGQTSNFAIDGANYRLANLTGCPVAAIVTSATLTGGVTGIGTTATTITVTPSSGSSTWCPIIGGAISLTCLTGVTGSTPGAGFLYPPTAIISAPPPGGLQATCHVTGIPGTGALLAAQIIIDNQGAGYPVLSTGVANATLTIINDPRDTVGNPGSAGVGTSNTPIRLAVTGTGQLTGLYPLNQGLPLTGVPTLAFSTGVATATAVMNFTVTSFVTGLTGVVFSTGAQTMMISSANVLTSTPIWTNPIHEKLATFPRPARISIAAGSTVTTTGAVVEDGGFGIQLVPALCVIGQVVVFTGALTGQVQPVAIVGGVVDYSWLQPI